MAIKGAKIRVAPPSILPVVGVWYRMSKDNKCGVMVIDHCTSADPSAPRSYKDIPVITKGSSLFLRLASACKIRVTGYSQKQAAKLVAGAIAAKGAIACKRVGKQHDWQDIQLYDWETTLQPFCRPKEGVKMESLLEEAPVAEEELDEESLVSIEKNGATKKVSICDL